MGIERMWETPSMDQIRARVTQYPVQADSWGLSYLLAEYDKVKEALQESERLRSQKMGVVENETIDTVANEIAGKVQETLSNSLTLLAGGGQPGSAMYRGQLMVAIRQVLLNHYHKERRKIGEAEIKVLSKEEEPKKTEFSREEIAEWPDGHLWGVLMSSEKMGELSDLTQERLLATAEARFNAVKNTLQAVKNKLQAVELLEKTAGKLIKKNNET